MMPGFRRVFDYLPNTTDWYGRWRLNGRPENDWLIDREAQARGGNYTGIDGIHAQDQAVTESMGPITDHLFEHLAPSDMMIMRTRRRLLQAARALAKDGTVPPGVDDPEIMYAVRSGDFVTEAGLGWRAGLRPPDGRLGAAAAAGGGVAAGPPDDLIADQALRASAAGRVAAIAATTALRLGASSRLIEHLFEPLDRLRGQGAGGAIGEFGGERLERQRVVGTAAERGADLFLDDPPVVERHAHLGAESFAASRPSRDAARRGSGASARAWFRPASHRPRNPRARSGPASRRAGQAVLHAELGVEPGFAGRAGRCGRGGADASTNRSRTTRPAGIVVLAAQRQQRVERRVGAAAARVLLDRRGRAGRCRRGRPNP